MKLTISRHGLPIVEHSIAPPMQMVITIPVTAEGDSGRKANVIVYVCTSPFTVSTLPTSEHELSVIAAEVARRLEDSK